MFLLKMENFQRKSKCELKIRNRTFFQIMYKLRDFCWKLRISLENIKYFADMEDLRRKQIFVEIENVVFLKWKISLENKKFFV